MLLDLAAIRDTLLDFESSKGIVCQHAQVRIRRLVAAYELLDNWSTGEVRLLSHGSSKAILELNHTVLYGSSFERSDRYHRALKASEMRFYNGDETSIVQGVTGGIADLAEWCDRHVRLGVYERAAGIILRTLASPQLFVEGNHRTAMLLASHELLSNNEPPLVLSAEYASEWTLSLSPIAELSRGSLGIWVQEPRLRRKLAQLILRTANSEHLLS